MARNNPDLIRAEVPHWQEISKKCKEGVHTDKAAPHFRIVGNQRPYCTRFDQFKLDDLIAAGIKPEEICPHLSASSLRSDQPSDMDFYARCEWPLNLITGKVEEYR